MKKALLILTVVIGLLVIYEDKEKTQIVIPTQSIRFRVIANSNEEIDMTEKQNLKDYMEDVVYELIKDTTTKDEANEKIIDNFDFLNSKVNDYLENDNYSLDYGINYFPRKIYKGVIYEEGMYDSLVITLGNGKGNNWWCVLFPPLCLLDENTTTGDVEYQLFISRIINNFK